MKENKNCFISGKTYYNSENGWKLKYIDRTLDGNYNFKIIEHNDPEQDWSEYSTKDGSEIVEKYEKRIGTET
jgi:hypothetical protein